MVIPTLYKKKPLNVRGSGYSQLSRPNAGLRFNKFFRELVDIFFVPPHCISKLSSISKVREHYHWFTTIIYYNLFILKEKYLLSLKFYY